MDAKHARRIFPFLFFSVFFLSLSQPLTAEDDKSAKAVMSMAQQTLDSASQELDAAFAEYNAAVEAVEQQEEEFEANLNDQGDPRVLIQLTYPVGKSPKVFTKGWVFGAEALFNPTPEDDESDPEDLSAQVKWEGSGTFSPSKGKLSHPTFSGEGDNTIVLSIEIDGKKITKTVHVSAVSSAKYAKVGSLAFCPFDAHGCPACPHPVTGPVETGSSLVLIDGKPAARVGDTGVHAKCCGPNTFTVTGGDPDVLIEGKPAARLGDETKHCGGMGKIQTI